jgi:hypothetical protein
MHPRGCADQVLQSILQAAEEKMVSDRVETVSIKGKQRALPAVQVGPNAVVIVGGRFPRIGRIHDEVWLEPKDIPEPPVVIEKLRQSPCKLDLFTFAQKLPHVSVRYGYKMEWDNLAVANVDSYTTWYRKIHPGARYSIHKSTREGVRTEVVPFTDDLVHGICSIYNESTVRQGKRFWHYGKPFATVKSDNSSYLERSIFIGAFFGDELIGFIKLVLSGLTATIMQVISKTTYFKKCPTNALLSRAVQVCEASRIKYLVYGSYVYGSNERSTLLDFKRRNGFEEVEVPRYYVPLNFRGRILLQLGLHKGVGALVPPSARSFAIMVRQRLLKNRLGEH